MTIYILTRINEDYEVLATKAYLTLAEAQAVMRKEYEAERSCFYTEDSLRGSEIQDRYARVNYGDCYFYDWTITQTELAI